MTNVTQALADSVDNIAKSSKVQNATANRQTRILTSAVVVLLWLSGFLPNLLGYLIHGRTLNLKDGTFQEQLEISKQATLGLQVLTVAAALALILASGRKGGATKRSITPLLLAVAPWVSIVAFSGFMLARDGFSLQWLQFPLVAIALWIGGSVDTVVRTVTAATIVGASSALVLGLVAPFGLMVSGWRTDDKAIFGESILAGQYSHPNGLAITLALRLPFVLLSSRSHKQRLFAPLIVLAIVWTSARSIIFATAIIIVIWLALLGVSSRTARAVILRISMIASATYCVVLPATVSQPTDYTNRGEIWSASLKAILGSPVFGSGPLVFLKENTLTSSLGFLPSHGHNLLISILATGGILSLLVVAASLNSVWRDQSSEARYPGLAKLGVVALLLCGTMEGTLQFQTVYQMTYILWPLLCLPLMKSSWTLTETDDCNSARLGGK